jgi:hypothetical protein
VDRAAAKRRQRTRWNNLYHGLTVKRHYGKRTYDLTSSVARGWIETARASDRIAFDPHLCRDRARQHIELKPIMWRARAIRLLPDFIDRDILSENYSRGHWQQLATKAKYYLLLHPHSVCSWASVPTPSVS